MTASHATAATPVVGTRRGAVGDHQRRAVRDRSALAPRQAGHGVPGGDRLPGQLAPEPGRAAEDQDVHRGSPIPRGSGVVLAFALHVVVVLVVAVARPVRARPGSPVARGSAGSPGPAGCRAG